MFGKGSRKLETILGAGSRIEGKLCVEGTVRIDGVLEGDVVADWLVVGETGKIRGNSRTRGMVVGGAVEGNVDAGEIVELKETARVTGEIRAPKLTVSEGAVFDGRSRMKGEADADEEAEGNVRTLLPTKTGA
jgi:cytoskeletal protein CcmA (bactofilin family)